MSRRYQRHVDNDELSDSNNHMAIPGNFPYPTTQTLEEGRKWFLFDGEGGSFHFTCDRLYTNETTVELSFGVQYKRSTLKTPCPRYFELILDCVPKENAVILNALPQSHSYCENNVSWGNKVETWIENDYKGVSWRIHYSDKNKHTQKLLTFPETKISVTIAQIQSPMFIDLGMAKCNKTKIFKNVIMGESELRFWEKMLLLVFP